MEIARPKRSEACPPKPSRNGGQPAAERFMGPAKRGLFWDRWLAAYYADRVPVHVDVDKQEVRFGDRVIKAAVPDGPRKQLVAGTWDSTAVLLDAGAAIEATAKKLPYVVGY